MREAPRPWGAGGPSSGSAHGGKASRNNRIDVVRRNIIHNTSTTVTAGRNNTNTGALQSHGWTARSILLVAAGTVGPLHACCFRRIRSCVRREQQVDRGAFR